MLLELYGITLRGDEYWIRYLVLAALVGFMGYLHVTETEAYERFCAVFILYLGFFGGLTLLVPYRDSSFDLFVAQDQTVANWFYRSKGLIPQECLPAINFEGTLYSECELQSINILWFILLGLPYSIIGLNGLGSDFFTGVAFLTQSRSWMLALYCVLKAVPLLFVLYTGFSVMNRKSPFIAVRWAGGIIFLFIYHGLMGGGTFFGTY